MLPIFDQVFGPAEERRRKHLCAVGFEANPKHTEYLQVGIQIRTNKEEEEGDLIGLSSSRELAR